MLSMFRSTFRNLRVEIPPEEFDYTVNKLGQKIKYKPLCFEDGAFQTEDDTIVHFLRNHTGNKEKGGSDFWELSESETRAVLGIFGPTAKAPEQILSEKQKDVLSSLLRLSNTTNGKINVLEACEKISVVMSLYKITGIAYPVFSEALKARSIKALAIQIIDLLEKENLITEAEIKGFENGDRKENP